MSDFTVEIFRTCEANLSWSTTVEGSNGEVYAIHYDGIHGWSCDCMSFKCRKSCKHVTKAQLEKCDHGWEAFAGSPSDDWVGPEQLCPKCGGESALIKAVL